MFYQLSKIFVHFLAPENWIYFLLLLAFITRRKTISKHLLITAFVVFVLFSNEFLFSKFTNWWQPSPVQLPADSRFSAGILLGGFTMGDKNDNSYFSESSDRFIQTLLLYKQGIINKIILTGTNKPGKISEAEFLQKQFILAGVPDSDLIVETQARNTAENVLYTRRKIDSLNLQPPYVVITSAFHIRRTEKVFKKVGLPVILYPAAYITVNKSTVVEDILLPQADILRKWRMVIKEIVGTWMYELTGRA